MKAGRFAAQTTGPDLGRLARRHGPRRRGAGRSAKQLEILRTDSRGGREMSRVADDSEAAAAASGIQGSVVRGRPK